MILFPLKEKIPIWPSVPGADLLVARAQRFRRVLDQRHAVQAAGVEDGIHVRGLPVEVGEDHGPRHPAPAPRVLELLSQERGIHVPAALVRVDEDRRSAFVDDRVRAGHEGQRRAEHLVARPDAGEAQGQVERGGAARERRRMADAQGLAELPLQRIHVRTERGDPVGPEGLRDQRHFLAAHVRRGEKESAHARYSG
jgi:hypothetical protein